MAYSFVSMFMVFLTIFPVNSVHMIINGEGKILSQQNGQGDSKLSKKGDGENSKKVQLMVTPSGSVKKGTGALIQEDGGARTLDAASLLQHKARVEAQAGIAEPPANVANTYTALGAMPDIKGPLGPPPAMPVCKACMAKAKKCKTGKESECSSWSSGLTPGLKLAFGAALQAGSGTLSKKLPCTSIMGESKCAAGARLRKRSSEAPTVSGSSKAPIVSGSSEAPTVSGSAGASFAPVMPVGTTLSLSETSDAPGCANPATDDPESWLCDCFATVSSKCGSVDEKCIHRLMCESANVCQSWKDEQEAPCATKGLLLQQRVNGTDQMLKRSQSNTETDGTRTSNIDHSMVGKCSSEER